MSVVMVMAARSCAASLSLKPAGTARPPMVPVPVRNVTVQANAPAGMVVLPPAESAVKCGVPLHGVDLTFMVYAAAAQRAAWC